MVIATPKLSERESPARKKKQRSQPEAGRRPRRFWAAKPWSNRDRLRMKPVPAQPGSFTHARYALLVFVFAVFRRADGLRAVRVFFLCNTHASSGLRAIHAASACSTRASTRASVFGDAHAFSCWSLQNSTGTRERSSKYFARRSESSRFLNAERFGRILGV